MELYDAIFYRKSTKQYSQKKVKKELLEEVKNICSQITYLNKELNIKAHVIDRGHLISFLMGKNCKVKSPHYIIITSDKGEDYLQNIGYAMEEVVLKLTSLGIATCWLECNIKREDILEFVDLESEEDLDANETEEENKENNIHLYEEKQKKNLSDTNKISMGIALRHFDIACKEFGVDVNYLKMNTKKKLGKEYYITAALNIKNI